MPAGKKVKHSISMASCGQKNVHFVMLICVASVKPPFSIVNGTYMYDYVYRDGGNIFSWSGQDNGARRQNLHLMHVLLRMHIMYK